MLNFQSTNSSTADMMKLRVKGVCVKGQSNTGWEHNLNSFKLDVVGSVLCLQNILKKLLLLVDNCAFWWNRGTTVTHLTLCSHSLPDCKLKAKLSRGSSFSDCKGGHSEPTELKSQDHTMCKKDKCTGGASYRFASKNRGQPLVGDRKWIWCVSQEGGSLWVDVGCLDESGSRCPCLR